MNKELFAKYDVAAPRYTSYPTVPYWDKNVPTQEEWKQSVKTAWENGDHRTSLYIHLPFCENLCTYCACNTRITKNHAVEIPYIESLQKEWKMYTDLLDGMIHIQELHLGGGTPTFFRAENLSRMMDMIREHSVLDANSVLSFEAHPANTDSSHLETLFMHGFRRISLGIQDFDPTVQRLINRMQSEEQVKALTNLARIIGYTSVNFDLIYGLPRQTIASITETIRKVTAIRPDRIAFYSYAHVPWMRPGQRAYDEKDLPTGQEKRELYETGREILDKAGYVEIGLDHFALPGDELLNASLTGKLHRNFMGYTEKYTPLLIGLGVSSISDSGDMLVQNEKTLEQWNSRLSLEQVPVFRGHKLTEEDMIVKRHILEIMCKGESYWKRDDEKLDELPGILERLKGLERDGLIEIRANGVKVLPAGRAFMRNVGMCFDLRYHRAQPDRTIFSHTA